MGRGHANLPLLLTNQLHTGATGGVAQSPGRSPGLPRLRSAPFPRLPCRRAAAAAQARTGRTRWPGRRKQSGDVGIWMRSTRIWSPAGLPGCCARSPTPICRAAPSSTACTARAWEGGRGLEGSSGASGGVVGRERWSWEGWGPWRGGVGVLMGRLGVLGRSS